MDYFLSPIFFIMINLVTLQEFKLYLQEKFTTSDELNEKDIYYTNILIPGASKALIQLLGQDFENKARSETFTILNDQEFITLANRPVSSLTTITINGDVQDITNYYLDGNSVGIKGDATFSAALSQSNVRFGKVLWPKSYADTIITYVGGRELERADKWILCKAIAKLDMVDKKTFTTTDDAQGAIETEFESNKLFRQTFAQYEEVFI